MVFYHQDETILTEKDKRGETPLDYAIASKASDEIKALLQPCTIKNEPAIASDDTSNLAPDDHGNDTSSTTMLQDQQLQVQVQAAY